MAQEILITKADGTKEPFNEQKLHRSLVRAGASGDISREIISAIEKKLFNGIPTQKIYRWAFEMLQKKELKPVAANYSIKRAVFDLGPSGFPFEDFVAEIFNAKGFTVSTGNIVKGKCAEHEVDLVAYSPKGKDESFISEIKFHNHLGIKTDLKVLLYVHARFNDILAENDLEHGVGKGILITNTKFSHNAISYGECSGIEMIGWEYPEKHNLYDLINETGLHPITCLTTLSKQHKKRLINDKVVLCRSIKNNTSLLEQYGVSAKKVPEILQEISVLCKPGSGV